MWLKQAHILERTLVVFRGILEELLEVEIILVLVDLIAIETIQVLVAIMMEETLLTSFVKYASFLVMEQTGAKIDTILNLSLKGTLEEAILMVVSNLDKDNMARTDLFMAFYRGFGPNFGNYYMPTNSGFQGNVVYPDPEFTSATAYHTFSFNTPAFATVNGFNGITEASTSSAQINYIPAPEVVKDPY